MNLIDFSPLDGETGYGFHNLQAKIVSNFNGIAFTAAPDVIASGEEADFFSNVKL